jgi:hypothetical protein
MPIVVKASRIVRRRESARESPQKWIPSLLEGSDICYGVSSVEDSQAKRHCRIPADGINTTAREHRRKIATRLLDQFIDFNFT